MKKRKNVILSAITCFVSICLLMIGVYAASSPSVSIGGQVSYTARDASVLVQGKTSNDGTEIAFIKSAPASKTALLVLDKTSDKVNKSANGDTPAEYFDWTQGEKSGNSSDTNETLSAWDIGTISFKESSTGIQEIKVKFLFTNYSNYPVTATLTFDKTVKETSDKNVTRTSEEQDKVITKELGIAGSANASATVEITYAVKDDSKGVDATGLLGMNINFEKYDGKASLIFDTGAEDSFFYNYYVTVDSITADGVSVTENNGVARIPFGSKVVIGMSAFQDCGPAYSPGYYLTNQQGNLMKKDVDYKVTSTENESTQGGWYDYTFTIENFQGATLYMKFS